MTADTGAPSQLSEARNARPEARIDPAVAHPTRVYGYWLGGKDHYPADRNAARAVSRARPEVVAGARANRYFLAQVVRYLPAGCGIRQFLDVGTGLSAPDNTHQVAQRAAPGVTSWEQWC